MTQPRRRPLQRDDLDVETTLRRAVERAPEIELGWSVLRQEMRDAGWPARSEGVSVARRAIVIVCRDCDAQMTGSAARDAHSAQCGHAAFEYRVTPSTIDPSCIDYADTTGDMALRLDHLADDLEQMQDHWRAVEALLRRMADIARKYMPASSPALPSCSITSCDGVVETTASGGYRGMDQVAGVWCAKPGVSPTCLTHRLAFVRSGRYHDGIVV